MNYNYWNNETNTFGFEDIGKLYVDSENDIIYILYNEPPESENNTKYKIVVTGSDLEANVEHIFNKFDVND